MADELAYYKQQYDKVSKKLQAKSNKLLETSTKLKRANLLNEVIRSAYSVGDIHTSMDELVKELIKTTIYNLHVDRAVIFSRLQEEETVRYSPTHFLGFTDSEQPKTFEVGKDHRFFATTGNKEDDWDKLIVESTGCGSVVFVSDAEKNVGVAMGLISSELIGASHTLSYDNSDQLILETFIQIYWAIVSRKEIELDFLGILESKVQERTAQLAAKNREINSMLENLEQGIAIFGEELKISEQHSEHLKVILDTEDLVDRSLITLVFEDSHLSRNDRDQIHNTLMSAFDSDLFAYEANDHLLPREVELGRKTVELDWRAITNDDHLVEKIMLVLRDVTQVRALQRGAEEGRRELERIGKILDIGVAKFRQFADVCRGYLDISMEDLQARRPDIELQFRNMHTIKGNARMFELTEIVDTAHHAEELLHMMRQQDSSEWDLEQCVKNLNQVSHAVEVYDRICHGQLSSHGASAKGDLIESLVEYLDAIGVAEKQLGSCTRRFLRDQVLPLEFILRDHIAGLQGIASELAKEPPKVVVEPQLSMLPTKLASILGDSFTHLLRNSMDHGLETADERRKKKKSPQGTIVIKVSDASITVQDDGRGLNLEALAKGEDMDDDAIAERIFGSGVSTAESVTDISGRGVGMDSVRAALAQIGCDIRVDFTGPRKGKFRPFRLVIQLPGEEGITLAS